MGYIAEIDKLSERVFSLTKNAYGDDLVSFALFGSVARRSSRPDSDIDLLIVAETLPPGRMRRIAYFEEKIERAVEKNIANLGKKGIHAELSPVFKTKEEVMHGSPLFLDMIDSARILFDREGFFRHYLKTLQVKLKKLGSRRVRRGNAWYWILKPDYKQGEVIEL